MLVGPGTHATYTIEHYRLSSGSALLSLHMYYTYIK